MMVGQYLLGNLHFYFRQARGHNMVRLLGNIFGQYSQWAVKLVISNLIRA